MLVLAHTNIQLSGLGEGKKNGIYQGMFLQVSTPPAHVPKLVSKSSSILHTLFKLFFLCGVSG